MEPYADQSTNEKPIIKKAKKAPTGLIILGGLSFIPFIGILFGAISILISLTDFGRFRIMFILGLSGIIFSIIIYSAIYYFGFIKRGGTYDELRVEMNQILLKEIDNDIVKYKSKYGFYPNDLKSLLKENGNLNLKDPIINVIKNYKGDSLFYYKTTPSEFMLFSIGFDGKPFTKDDIYPAK